MSLSVAVVGASGYAGGELLRLLSRHPDFEVTMVTARSSAGRRLGEVHPHLRRYRDLVLETGDATRLAEHDVVFVAVPHGKSGAITADLPESVLVVDAGADHRLESRADWDAFYGGEYFGAWTYGVPELPLLSGARQREALRSARRIAAPGCNASTVELALAPAAREGLVDVGDLVAVLAVGTSGAGRSPAVRLLASEILGSAGAYKVGGVHRHIPEIEQGIRWVSGKRGRVSFTPVLVPMSRGILATVTAPIRTGVTEADVRSCYDAVYGREEFIEVLPAGSFPRTADVLGSNVVSLGLAVDAHAGRLVVVAAVDNLVKGTAGAAIQSANIALGLAEDAGLTTEGVAP